LSFLSGSAPIRVSSQKAHTRNDLSAALAGERRQIMVRPIAKLTPGDRVIFRDDAGHWQAPVRTPSTVTGNVRPGWGAEKCRIQDGAEAAASPRISRAPLG